MLVVQHRSASSPLDSVWEFDPARRAIDIVFGLDALEPIAFTIPVCAIDRPRFGAHAMVPLDDACWRLLPSFFVVSEAAEVVAGIELHGVRSTPPKTLSLEPRDCHPRFDEERSPCRLHHMLGCGTQIVLANASPTVEIELLEL